MARKEEAVCLVWEVRENDVELHRQGIGTGTASVIKSESYFLYMRELISPLGAAVEGRSSADSAGGGKRCSCTVRQEDNRLSSTVHDESDLASAYV